MLEEIICHQSDVLLTNVRVLKAKLPKIDLKSVLAANRIIFAIENVFVLLRYLQQTSAQRKREQTVEPKEKPMLGLTQPSNYLTLKDSFSAVSKPNFATKYALESSRRDLQNALLCTVLVGSVWAAFSKLNFF